MTILEMHEWLNILIDKYNSPYFTTTELDTFLNRAQANYVNNLVYKKIPSREGLRVVSASEHSSDWEMLLQPLIFDNSEY